MFNTDWKSSYFERGFAVDKVYERLFIYIYTSTRYTYVPISTSIRTELKKLKVKKNSADMRG